MTAPQNAVPTTCEAFYRQLSGACADVVAATFAADTAAVQAGAHSFVSDIETWLAVISTRPEAVVLRAALREYEFALLAVVQGQYRQAFMALRLSLELFLATVHHSANELELRIWLRGERDLAWSTLVSIDNGVFSKRFVRAFFEELADEAGHYGAIAQKVYRECSEYVHGNPPTGDVLPDKIVFAPHVFADWHAKAKAVRLASSFALCGRYVRLLDEPLRLKLEHVLLDNLGHLPALRITLGAAAERENA